MDEVLDGRGADVFAGQAIQSAQGGVREDLHFWVRETPRGNAEVDYVVPGPGFPVPVEVKSGSGGRLRSVHQFLARSELDTAVRLHAGARADEQLSTGVGGTVLSYRLISMPLYLAELVPQLAATLPTR